MKSSYPWLAPLALLSFANLWANLGCSPDNKVKPGAPVLVSVAIMDSATGATTEITGTTPLCSAAVGAGGICDPATQKLCRLGASTWCNCVADGEDATKGAWACDPLAPTSMIVATFDRILDGKPFEFDPDAGAGPAGIASIVSMPPSMADVVVDYSPNGDAVGLVFPLFFGIKGPRILITPSPTLPSGSTIALTLSKDNVRAKDGKTPFTGGDLLKDGMLSFMTAPFAATITVPELDPDAGAPPPAEGGVEAGAEAGADGGVTDGGVDVPVVAEAGVDSPAVVDAAVAEAGGEAGADGGAAEAAPMMPPPAPVMPGEQPVSIAFNNLTDAMAIPMHIKVTVNGAPFANVTIAPPDDMHPGYTVAPTEKWPANATITITVDADAADVLGVKLGMPASATFVTGS